MVMIAHHYRIIFRKFNFIMQTLHLHSMHYKIPEFRKPLLWENLNASTPIIVGLKLRYHKITVIDEVLTVN